jgi:hypothetical protein
MIYRKDGPQGSDSIGAIDTDMPTFEADFERLYLPIKIREDIRSRTAREFATNYHGRNRKFWEDKQRKKGPGNECSVGDSVYSSVSVAAAASCALSIARRRTKEYLDRPENSTKSLDAIAIDVSYQDDGFLTIETEDELNAIRKRLSDRESVLLDGLLGYRTVEELQDQLALSRQAVDTALHRLRKKLRRMC